MNNNIIDKIKILRAKTNISFAECKKALIETQLNIEEAIVYLRKMGLLNSIKRNDKLTLEGLIISKITADKKTAVIIEINCETDFVAKSEDFINFSTKILEYFLNENNEKQLDLKKNIDLPEILETERINVLAKFKENIIINRIKKISSEENQIFGYVHGAHNYGKIASLMIIKKETDVSNDLIKDIAMQIVAMKPKYLKIDLIPTEIIEKEKVIITENTNKNYKDKTDEQIKNIINNQLKKFYEEVVLIEQPFIKDQKLKIKDIIKNKVRIENFIRFEIGEEN